jgi:hypothetical protein
MEVPIVDRSPIDMLLVSGIYKLYITKVSQKSDRRITFNRAAAVGGLWWA